MYRARPAQAAGQRKAVLNLDAIGISNAGKIIISGDNASRPISTQLVNLGTDRYALSSMGNGGYLNGDDEYFRRQGCVAIIVTTHLFGTEPLHPTDRDRIENFDLNQIAAITDLLGQWIGSHTP